MSIANDITELIGETPILKLNRLPAPEGARLLAKLEWYNVSGSIKDRMAKYLLDYAEVAGNLKRGKTILEATSGNTGIALAMISAAKGYGITIVMPESVSVERRKLIKAYGAKLILSSGAQGTAGAIEVKRKLLSDSPERYVDVDQFKDPANLLAHYQTTGPEILRQTGGQVDAVVVGVGTAGTGVGVSQCLKEHNPKIRVVGVTPKLGFAIQGLRNPAEVNPTQLFRREKFDEVVELSKDDQPAFFEVARRAGKEEGLLVGISAGAILYVAIREAKSLGEGKTVVAVLPDSGFKYLSTPLYEE